MAILLFPGRHLVMTKFQEEYCADLLSRNVSELVLEGTFGGQVDEKIDHLVFAITSANQSGSRYNPVPLHARITAIDRFVARLRARSSPGGSAPRVAPDRDRPGDDAGAPR